MLMDDGMNKYDTVMTQIQILKSDKARQKSLILCTKPEKIKSGRNKEYGFLKYLSKDLDEEDVGCAAPQQTHFVSEGLFCTKHVSQLHPGGGLNKSPDPVEGGR